MTADNQPGVPSDFTRRSRRLRRLVAKSAPARSLAVLRAHLNGRTLRRVLVFSDNREYTSEQQFAPLLRFQQQIASRFGLVFRFADVSEIEALAESDLKGVYAVGLKLSFRNSAAEAWAVTEKVFAIARAAGARTIYFDGDDDQCVQWPAIIDAADVYIKKHRFSDESWYTRGYVGKSNLTDYAHRNHGIDFSQNIITDAGPLTATQAGRIVLGWNIALDDKLFDLAKDIGDAALSTPRDIDVLCRASMAPDIWTHQMRHNAVTAISGLEDRYTVQAPTDRVSQGEYYREMLRSKLSVSPFGFGELCWRDFETILCGGVLVKQDMAHVETWPNLFVPHETYVPVAWDFNDLESTCQPYLDDDGKREQVARNARERLLDALSRDAFLDRFGSMLDTVWLSDLPSG